MRAYRVRQEVATRRGPFRHAEPLRGQLTGTESISFSGAYRYRLLLWSALQPPAVAGGEDRQRPVRSIRPSSFRTSIHVQYVVYTPLSTTMRGATCR